MTVDLRPFVSRSLLDALAGEIPRRQSRYRAALLLADVSGFTSLTERFQRRGRQGAEEVGRVLEQARSRMVAPIDRWGGGIESFGGDAAFAIFRGTGAMQRARACASELQEQISGMRLSTTRGAVKLRIKQVLHWGLVHQHLLQNPVRGYGLVTGPAVVHLAGMEARARPDRIVVSTAARARLKSGRPATAPAPRELPQGDPAPFAPPWLAERLAGFRGRFLHPSLLFLELAGWGRRELEAFAASLRAIHDFGGSVLEVDPSPYGSKWLCAFGLSMAHEDEAERAARAGLRVLSELPAGVRVRGAVHGGVVANIVLDSGVRKSLALVGDAVNTCARACQCARWGEVVVTDSSRGGLRSIRTRRRKGRLVRGKRRPLVLHGVLGVGGAVAATGVLGPLVGRARELERLVRGLASAADGASTCLTILAEAGMGKTRMLQEVGRLASEKGFEVHWAGGDPYRGGLYGAVAQFWEGGRFEVTNRGDEQSLLGHALRGEPLPPDLRSLPGALLRARTEETLARALLDRSRHRRTLYLVDDYQWVDGGSRTVLKQLAEGSGHHLLVVGSRTSTDVPGRSMALSPLERSEILRMVGDRVTGRAGRDLVLERGAGNPLFVEELIRHLVEQGLASRRRLADDVDLPDRMEQIVEARLGRLAPEAYQALEVASVLGRRFSLAMLKRNLPRALVRGIELAHREGLIGPQPGKARGWLFRQVLVRDVVYGGLLGARLRELHARAAEVLERLPEARRRWHLPALAHHWDRAGEPGRARPYYLEAAKQAMRSFALEESESLYLAYLRSGGISRHEHLRAELDLAESVYRMQRRHRDYERVMRHALDASLVSGDREAEARARKGLGMLACEQGRMDEGQGLLQQAVDIHRDRGDRLHEAVALNSLAVFVMQHGEPLRAMEMLERAYAMHRDDGDLKRAGVVLANKAVNQVQRGQQAEARRSYEQALVLHRRSRDRMAEGRTLETSPTCTTPTESSTRRSSATGRLSRCSGRSATSTRWRSSSPTTASPWPSSAVGPMR